MDKGSEQTFLKDTQHMICEKVLNNTNQRNANQNHNEILTYTCQNGQYPKDKKILGRMWKKGKSVHHLVRI